MSYSNNRQQEFENYLIERRRNDPRFNNILIGQNDSSINHSSSDEDEEYERTNHILKQDKKRDSNELIVENHTIVVNSKDRNLYDPQQNRMSFKVKFSPSNNSFTRKIPIYYNSSYFLQTEYQKKMGIQGYPRNIDIVKEKELLGEIGSSTATRQCEEQYPQGSLYYRPEQPLGELIGYNILFENADDNNANIQTKFTNISSIELERIILPLNMFVYPWNTTLYGNIYEQIPYVYIKIPELTSNYNSTSNELRDVFSVMIPEKNNNLEFLNNTYISFVPISKNSVYTYKPLKNGLNLMTINLFIPPVFSFSPPSIGIFNGYDGLINSSNPNIALNNTFSQVQSEIFKECIDVKQILIFKSKQEPSEFLWKRKSSLSGVNQPSSFLQERNIYDCPKGNFNKGEIINFAIVTKDYFNKDLFVPGSIIKLVNYINNLSTKFSLETDLDYDRCKINTKDPTSLFHYIPNLFIEGTEEANNIWSDDSLLKEGRNFLIRTLQDFMQTCSSYLNSEVGVPITEVGFIESKNKNNSFFPSIQRNDNGTSSDLRNCYEYINSYINMKHLGLKREKIPFCNVIGTNKFTSPYKCDCIESENEKMIGFCKQITVYDFGDIETPFSFTNQGFYKGINKNYRPEGRVISGSNQTSDKNSLYSQKKCPSKLTLNNIKKKIFGGSNFYCNEQGLTDNSIDEYIQNKSFDNGDLNSVYTNILNNINKINLLHKQNNNQQDFDFFENNIKILELSIKNFFIDLKKIFVDISTINNIIDEMNTSLKSFHIYYIDFFFKINFEDLNQFINGDKKKNIFQHFNLNENQENIDLLHFWYDIVEQINNFTTILNIIFEKGYIDPEEADKNDIINLIINFADLFIEKEKDISNCDCDTNDLKCDDVCLDWGLSLGEPNDKNYRPSCFSDPLPFLPSNDNDDDYPKWQNEYCNGKKKGQENNLCKPCNKYKKGSNKDGLSNVIVIPFPSILSSVTGEYFNLTFTEKIQYDFLKIPNLGYTQDKKLFHAYIYAIAFTILKQVLYNGGPASFPDKKIKPGGSEFDCKILSLSQQNTFIFNIQTKNRNINDII